MRSLTDASGCATQTSSASSNASAPATSWSFMRIGRPSSISSSRQPTEFLTVDRLSDKIQIMMVPIAAMLKFAAVGAHGRGLPVRLLTWGLMLLLSALSSSVGAQAPLPAAFDDLIPDLAAKVT